VVDVTGRISIDRRTAPEQIAQGLKELVLSQALPAGRSIRESALAAELGVSRNTVREAVRILERSGLVRYEVNRGAVVREPSADSLRDLYRARLAIEVGAALAAPTEAAAVALRGALDQLLAALAAGDEEAAVAADLAFHATVVRGARSARLDTAYAPIANELRLYLTILAEQRREYADRDRVAAEHEVIVAAFEAGDGPLAAHELGEHIRGNAARMAVLLDGAPHPEPA